MRRMVSEASAWCQVGRRCCHFPICELSSSFRHRRARARQDAPNGYHHRLLQPRVTVLFGCLAACMFASWRIQIAWICQVKYLVLMMPCTFSTARRPPPAPLRFLLRQPV
jgi:hypothetical protein